LKRVKIDDRSAADIDRIVTKLHRDIGDPTGPVDLAAKPPARERVVVHVDSLAARWIGYSGTRVVSGRA